MSGEVLFHYHGIKKAASQAANKGAAKPPDYIRTGAVLIVAWPRLFLKRSDQRGDNDQIMTNYIFREKTKPR